MIDLAAVRTLEEEVTEGWAPWCGDSSCNGVEDFAGCPQDCAPDDASTSAVESSEGAASAEPTDETSGSDASTGECTGCEDAPRVVFISSETYNGDLGGVDGADAKCQELAKSRFINKTFKAWITTNSSGEQQLIKRLRGEGFKGRYTLTNGDVVAEGWAGLSALRRPIDITEEKQRFDGEIRVWTNTRPDGEPSQTGDCDGWSSSAVLTGGVGLAEETAQWTTSKDGEGGIPCSLVARIYCFEAPRAG
jgi:hypothetical protein